MLQELERLKNPCGSCQVHTARSEGMCIFRFQVNPLVPFECGGLSCVCHLKVSCLSGEKLHISDK